MGTIGVIMKTADEQWKELMCNRIAAIIHEHFQFKKGIHSRLFEVLIPDALVTDGESLRGNQYREHAVPLCLIRDECLKMFANGASVEAVADSIEKHVSIIRIAFHEAKELNMTLKNTMPEGWIYNRDDIYARLDKVGIKYTLTKKDKRVAA